MRVAILSILFIVSVKTSAQVDIICPKLVDSSLNYFYIGIDNPINIVGIKYPNNYRLSISGGGTMMTKVSGDKYIVKANSVTDNCQIQLIDQKGKTFFKKDFNVRSIPEPVVSLAGWRDTAIQKQKVLLNPFLIVNFPGCYLQDQMNILSFHFTLVEDNDSLSSINNGYRFQQEVTDIIKKANPGSTIHFHDIRAYGADSRTRKLSPFWIKIE